MKTIYLIWSLCLAALPIHAEMNSAARFVAELPAEEVALPPSLVEQLELQLGQETVECSAQVVGKSLLRQSPVSVSAILALLLGGAKAEPLSSGQHR